MIRDRWKGKMVAGVAGVAVIAAGALLLARQPTPDAVAPGGHGHHTVRQPAGKLAGHGVRWQADMSLRQGMLAIRTAVAQSGAAALRDRAAAERLAAAVRGQVDFMIATCRLDPEPDEALHGLLMEIVDGTDTLVQRGRADAGLAKIEHALAAYPSLFEHPGWVE